MTGSGRAKVGRQRAEWSSWRLFWAVAACGGFGAAARALGIGQPTITRRINDLEKRLNTRLFVRQPHGVTLTEQGRLAYDRVVTMEHSAEAIENLILDSEKQPQGSVGIGAPDGIAGIFLPPHMPELVRAHPRISLHIDCGLWSEHPLDGSIDISLTFARPSHPDLIARPIAHFHYGLFAARSYLDLYGTPASLAECASHAYVHHSAQVHQKEAWHPQAAAFREIVSTRIETNSSAVSFQAVRQGAGIGLMPTAILAIEPSLVMLDIPDMGSLQMWMCVHRDIARSARIRLVADWIREAFDPKTKPWHREELIHPRDFMGLITGGDGPGEPPPGDAPADGRRGVGPA